LEKEKKNKMLETIEIIIKSSH